MARGIYKIINVINNKFYVGSAEDFARRKRVHWWMLRKGNHANKHLQAAWNRYGEAAFTFVLVEEHVANIDILAAENVWLHEHVGKDYCYNLGTDATAPNTGMFGEKNAMYGKTFAHTEEAKAKIAKASAERVQTDEEKLKRKRTMRGHIVPKETRAKISATLSGDGNFWHGKQRPDHGAKVSKAIEVYKDDVLLKVYDSIKALRDELGLKPPTVNRALKSGIKIVRGSFVGYSFKYTCTVTK